MRKVFGRMFLPIALMITITTCGLFHSEVATDLAYAQSEKSASDVLKFEISAGGLATQGMWKSTPVLVDMNGDGNLDLVAIARLGDGVHVWLGDGKGNWNDASDGLKMSSSCGGGVAVGDINKDGKMDIAVADHCYGVMVYLAVGPGRYEQTAEISSSLWKKKMEELAAEDENGTAEMPSFNYRGAETIGLGDVNEDGFLDIVSGASERGGFHVYLGDGSGRNWKELMGDGLPSHDDPEPGDRREGGWVSLLKLVDFNGDGHLDVVATYVDGPRVWLGDGKGRWSAFSDGLPEPSIGGVYHGIDVGDFNEDGLMDLVAGHFGSGAQLFLQKSDGKWDSLKDITPSIQGGTYGLAVGDFDGDGHLDVVVGGVPVGENRLGNIHGIFMMLGNGKGAFGEAPGTGLPRVGLSVLWGFAAGDIDKDGLLDFAVSSGGVDSETIKSQTKGNEQQPMRRFGKEVVFEAGFPRMQAWLNRGKK